MTAREFMSECNLFVEFGKIKDINFDNELHYEDIDDRVKVMNIDFEDNTVTLGTLVPFGCGDDCCGSFYEDKTYDLDRLAYNGYLDKIIDMMDNVLKVKTGI
jgi:hypothetical protein